MNDTTIRTMKKEKNTPPEGRGYRSYRCIVKSLNVTKLLKFFGYILCVVIAFGLFVVFGYDYRCHGVVKLPVSFSYSLLKPLMRVEIEGNTYNMLVDLGSNADDFTFEAHILEKIMNKESLGEIEIGDLKGNSYSCPRFRIPALKIGGMAIFNSHAIAQNHQFLRNVQVWTKPNGDNLIKQRSRHIDGKIGLSVFQNYNCLFDFPNSLVTLQKSTDKPLDFLEKFVSVPFTLEKCGVVLSVETDDGIQKMLLDTGSTFSVINRSPTNNDREPYCETKRLVIGECDYGSWDLAFFDISEELGVDGCLGADFFLEHAVYLDFQNQRAYIQRPDRFTLSTQWKRLKVRATRLFRKVLSAKIFQPPSVKSLAQGEESTEVVIEIAWDF